MRLLDPYAPPSQTNGVFPQVVSMGDGYPWEASDSLTRMVAWTPALVPPNMSSFHLDPATRPTDIIQQGYASGAGLLVSKRFCRVIDDYAVHPHEAYAAAVIFRGDRFPYRWIQLTQSFEPAIDFAESEFVVRSEQRERAITFASERELRTECSALIANFQGDLIARRVAFVATVPRLDLLALRLTSVQYFVSDQLTVRLNEEGLTGFTVSATATGFSSGGREWT